jgi:Domain of unknown function (DUF4166)
MILLETREAETIERLLGAAAWARLPHAVRQRFSGGAEMREYVGEGEFKASLVGRVFAVLGVALGRPLPLRTGSARVLIQVKRTAVGEVWRRAYGFARGDEIVRSVKQAGGGAWLEERAGPLIMRLSVFEAVGALVFECLDFRLRFAGFEMILPLLLTPGRIRVEHHDHGGGRFAFTLEARHPWFGPTFAQRCEMRDG